MKPSTKLAQLTMAIALTLLAFNILVFFLNQYSQRTDPIGVMGLVAMGVFCFARFGRVIREGFAIYEMRIDRLEAGVARLREGGETADLERRSTDIRL